MTVSYLSEPVADYHKALDACSSLEELRIFLSDWRLLANDAFEAAHSMNEADWPIYRKGLKSERRGRYSGDEWTKQFGMILLPDILFRVSIIAQKFCCPWGLAYCRAREFGKIIEQDGIAIYREQP